MDGESSWLGNTLPLARLLDRPGDYRLILDGYFQRSEYFASVIASTRSWFAEVSNAALDCVPARSDVVVHVDRESSLARRGWVLPISYYRSALKALRRPGDVFLCGPGVDERVRDGLAEFSPVLLTTDDLGTFVMIKRAKRTVLANTPLSWWAGWLSEATEIYGPCVPSGEGYAFRGYSDVDLHMRQVRYREVVVSEFCRTEVRMSNALAENHVFLSDDAMWIQRRGKPMLALSLNRVSASLAAQLTAVAAGRRRVAERLSGEDWAILNQLARAGLLEFTYRLREPGE